MYKERTEMLKDNTPLLMEVMRGIMKDLDLGFPEERENEV